MKRSKAYVLGTLFVMSTAFLIPGVGVAHEKGVDSLLKACKKECPDAKDAKSVEECAEAKEKGPDAAAFKKSACYKAHEKHDAEHGKSGAH